MNESKINEIFGAPEEIEEVQGELVETNETNEKEESTENDSYIDRELKNIIGEIDEQLNDIVKLAQDQESPRAYEVFSTLLKTKIDAIEKLANIERDKRKKVPESVTINNTQNNVGLNVKDIIKNMKQLGMSDE